ncbi:MAG: hypothetical protein ACO3F4_08190 [Ilumatobacteraceae bacterium]
MTLEPVSAPATQMMWAACTWRIGGSYSALVSGWPLKSLLEKPSEKAMIIRANFARAVRRRRAWAPAAEHHRARRQ